MHLVLLKHSKARSSSRFTRSCLFKMKKLTFYLLPFLILVCILCTNNLIVKLSGYRTVLLRNLENNPRTLRIRRAIKETHGNETFNETGVRPISSNESKNISNSNDTLYSRQALVEKFKSIWPVSNWRKYGYFTDDYLFLINEHWLQFPPPDATAQKILGSIYILFATAGCWGNIMVLFMYFK